jgi:hypothetical protein
VGDTCIYHLKQHILSLLHVVENAVGYVNELKHMPQLTIAHELSELDLEEDAAIALIHLLQVVNAALVHEEEDRGRELIRLITLNDLLDAEDTDFLLTFDVTFRHLFIVNDLEHLEHLGLH